MELRSDSDSRNRSELPDYSFSGQAATVDLLEKAREQEQRFDILAKPIKPEHLIQLIREKASLLAARRRIKQNDQLPEHSACGDFC